MLYQDLKPLSRQDHADLKLQPLPGYGYARTVTELPVHAYELPSLVAVFPLAFRLSDQGARLVALTGVEAGRNLFVGPRDGWGAIATPEVLETYPFAMERATEGKGVLCIDSVSDLLNRFEGAPLLDDQGQPTETLQGYQQKVKAQFRDRQATAKAIGALYRAGVLAPWDVSDVDALDANVHHYAKLPALEALSGETRAELAGTNALALAYAQAYSMANMRKLRRMAQRKKASQGDVSQYLKDDDALDFGDDAVLDFS